MKMSPPVVDGRFYEGGTSTCDACGQATTQLRRMDLNKPASARSWLMCFTCKETRPHTSTWDGVAFNSSGRSIRITDAGRQALEGGDG